MKKIKHTKAGKAAAAVLILILIAVLFSGCRRPEGPGPQESSAADREIARFLGSEELKNEDAESRMEKAVGYLDFLAEDGLVQKGSVEPSYETGTVAFRNSENELCYLDLTEEEEGTVSSEMTLQAAAVPGQTGMKKMSSSGMKSTPDVSVTLFTALYPTEKQNLDYYADVRSFFEQYSEKMDGSIEMATVDTMRTGLAGRDMCIIVCHGGLYDYGGTITPLIRAYDDFLTTSPDAETRSDMQSGRLVKVFKAGPDGNEIISKYLFTPEFFSYYYNGILEGTIIHLSSCHGFGDSVRGETTGNNFLLSNAFLNSGAAAVVGHDNSVYADYDKAIFKTELECLIEGETLGEALDTAIYYYEDNDVDYMRARSSGYFNSSSIDSHVPSHNEIRGDRDAVFARKSADPFGTTESGSVKWEAAYEDLLYTLPERARFSLAYLDQDDVPELIVATDNSHASMADIYRYANGTAQYVSSVGSFGDFLYDPGNNTIVYEGTYGGETEVIFYSLGRDSLEITYELYTDEYGVPEGAEPSYIIDHEPASAEEYARAYNEKVLYAGLVTAGYSTGVENTPENIEAYL